MFGVIAKAAKWVPKIIKGAALVFIIKEIKTFMDQLIDLIKTAKTASDELKQKADKCTETAANICAKIPGLGKHEQTLRDFIK